MEPTTRQIADSYAGCACTLDGKPAKITGRLLPFARVGLMEGSLNVEFAWQTVRLVMTEQNGAFRSVPS